MSDASVRIVFTDDAGLATRAVKGWKMSAL
jgi:hypothetical protein